MHILGLANGTVGGNSEILLKAALSAAQEADPSTTISWIHVPSVIIPTKSEARDLQDPLNANKEMTDASGKGNARSDIDDRSHVMNAILEADALIFATPVYSHLPAGALKVLFDRIGSMSTSFPFVHRVVEAKKMGQNTYDGIPVDRRVLKPRVAAFIVVAGSKYEDQMSMALPAMHQHVFPFHAKVVDQHIFPGCGLPGAVLLASQMVERAQTLGKNVVSQMGKAFDDARYLGEEEENSCPYCHLRKVEFTDKTMNGISCLACAARGNLEVDHDGKIGIAWEVESSNSFHTLKGILRHNEESLTAPLEEVAALPSVKDKIKSWSDIKFPRATLASNRRDKDGDL